MVTAAAVASALATAAATVAAGTDIAAAMLHAIRPALASITIEDRRTAMDTATPTAATADMAATIATVRTVTLTVGMVTEVGKNL